MNREVIPTEVLAAAEARIRATLDNETPAVQLDAALSAYINLATKLGVIEQCATALVEIGGCLLFKQFNQQAPARCAVPAPGDENQHPAPPTVQ